MIGEKGRKKFGPSKTTRRQNGKTRLVSLGGLLVTTVARKGVLCSKFFFIISYEKKNNRTSQYLLKSLYLHTKINRTHRIGCKVKPRKPPKIVLENGTYICIYVPNLYRINMKSKPIN